MKKYTVYEHDDGGIFHKDENGNYIYIKKSDGKEIWQKFDQNGIKTHEKHSNGYEWNIEDHFKLYEIDGENGVYCKIYKDDKNTVIKCYLDNVSVDVDDYIIHLTKKISTTQLLISLTKLMVELEK